MVVDSYPVIIDGVHTEVEVERAGSLIEARIGDRTYLVDVTDLGHRTYSFIWNGRCIEAIVKYTGEGCVVAIGDLRIPVELLDTRRTLRRADRSGHDGVAVVRAPMPGRIVRILVAEGSEVNMNQGIAVMEAMKMQNEIKSPKRGTIRKIEVADGAAVVAGDTIAIIE